MTGMRLSSAVDFQARIEAVHGHLAAAYGLGPRDVEDRTAAEVLLSLLVRAETPHDQPPPVVLDTDWDGFDTSPAWWSLGGAHHPDNLDYARGVRPRTAAKWLHAIADVNREQAWPLVMVDTQWRGPARWHANLCRPGGPIGILDGAIRIRVRTPKSEGSLSADARETLSHLARKAVESDIRSPAWPGFAIPQWLKYYAELSEQVTRGMGTGRPMRDRVKSRYMREWVEARIGPGVPQLGREMGWERLVSGLVEIAGRRAMLFGREQPDRGDWAAVARVLAWQTPMWTEEVLRAVSHGQTQPDFDGRISRVRVMRGRPGAPSTAKPYNLVQYIGHHAAGLGRLGVLAELDRLVENGVLQSDGAYTFLAGERNHYMTLLDGKASIA